MTAEPASQQQHHGEKEKLRGPGAGERPWHPSAHPDLPLEANQVRAASPGCGEYSCNRVGGSLGGGGRPAAAQWWGGSSDHSRNAKMRNKLVILHSAESNLCVLGTGEGFEAV